MQTKGYHKYSGKVIDIAMQYQEGYFFKNSIRIFFYLVLLSLLSMMVLCWKAPSFADDSNVVKSTKDINENVISDRIKSNINLDALRRKLDIAKDGSINEKGLIMESQFRAFPEKSKINLTLTGMDVASVLRIIAKEGGKNVVIDDSVKGLISAELRNVSLNDAMQTILTSQELEARVSGNTIFVASRPAMAKKGLNRKYIKAFKLNNSNAVYIAQILEASIFNKGYKVNDTSSNSASSAMQAIENQGSGLPTVSQSPQTTQSGDSSETTTGQSSLVQSKTIKGKVEELVPSDGFGDAKILASEMKVQYDRATTKDIKISNNDGGAIVIPDTRTNSVLVAGLQEDVALAEEAIKYLDKPLTQISLEVSLVELTKEDTNNLGLTVGAQSGQFSGGYNNPSATNAHGVITDVSNTGYDTGFSFNTVQKLQDEINLKINSLLKVHKAKLLANPTVLALDGSESLIKITDQIISRLTVTSQNNTGEMVVTPELSDIGIVLNILPKVGDNGYITMKIRPSITTFLRKEQLGTGYANLISTREVILQDTRVKAGETLAIAGLIKESEIEDVTKIPFAGDLPYIGKIFRNKTLSHPKTELVILITPKIISDVATN